MKQSWASQAVQGLFGLSCFAAVAFGEATPITDTRRIEVPPAVRAGEEAVVLLQGFIGDTCQKLLAPVVKVDVARQHIVVTPMTERVVDTCREIYLSYRQAVYLGKLPEGRYTVETYDGGVRETLYVTDGQ